MERLPAAEDKSILENIAESGYVSPPIGNETIAVLTTDNPEFFNSAFLKDRLRESLKEDDFEIVEGLKCEFKPHGHSTLFIRVNSYADVHTFPDDKYNTLYMNFVSCEKDADPRKACNAARDVFSKYSRNGPGMMSVDYIQFGDRQITYVTCTLAGLGCTLLKDSQKIDSTIEKALDSAGFMQGESKIVPVLLAEKLKESHVCIIPSKDHNLIFFSLYSCLGEKHGTKTYESFRQGTRQLHRTERPIYIKTGEYTRR